MTKLFDRMFRLKNNIRKDNRGTTLVEIIVALLILVLIFTPAYMAFSAALKLNQASKDRLYAENIAKNAMEIIKYTIDIGEDIYSVDFNSLGGSVVTPGAVVSGGAILTGPAVYTLSECPEGTTKYDVTININEIEEANRQEFADMSAFNDTATALINPSGEAGGFDSSVVYYFSELHKNYYHDLYQEDLEIVYAHNNDILQEWSEACTAALLAGEEPPEMPNYETDNSHNPTLLWNNPGEKTPETDEQLKKHMTKKMNVEMKYIKRSDDNMLVEKYRLDSDLTYTIDNNYLAGGVVQATGSAIEMSPSEYCNDVRYDSLDNIYILYTPLNSASEGAITLTNEEINIVNDIKEDGRGTDPINVFVVIQAENAESLNKNGSINGLKINVEQKAGAVRPIILYCNVNCDVSPDDSILRYRSELTPEEKHSLIDSNKAMKLIYDVGISVKETGSEGKSIELSSSIIKN